MIEQLKKLVLEGGYNAEDKQIVAELEDSLHRLSVAENLKENPIIKEYIDYLTDESRRCTYLLSNDRSLTEVQRLVIFEKRDICNRFIFLFDGTEKESLENEINDLLNVARSQETT